jgi:serine/threonine-protein kinase
MDSKVVRLIILFGLVLSACSVQPTATPEPVTPTVEAVATTATSAATATLAPVEPTLALTATLAPVEPTLAPTATSAPVDAAPAMGSTRVSEVDQMEQVFVPAGEFLLGALTTDMQAKHTVEGGRAYPESPQQILYLDAFWIDKYEVTTSQYKLCVEAGACRRPYVDYSETRPYYYGNPEFADYPVIYVSWVMANEYCAWAGRRLPTEAEWEKAARGTDGRIYPWGNDPIDGEKANFCDINCTSRTDGTQAFDDGWADTAPVGSYPAGASPYGALDMAGNVWEWTSTIIQDYPYDPNDGREDLSAPGERVWRGGPWSNGLWWQRSTLRYRSITSYWYVNLGFRCAASE